jgi:hypothetical protein
MRTHIVMVPGFGGFDALGKLNYYSGVTRQYDAWVRDHGASDKSRGRAVIHYFQNLPTAAVATRGANLARFVKRLVERHVIDGDDDIVLVGHSTGGLDIRHMIRALAAAGSGAGSPVARANPRDDAEQDARRAQELLARIHRVVFLSVPQRGTNIADWVREHRNVARTLVGLLRRAVGLPVSIPLAPVEHMLRMLTPGHAELIDAVDDAGRDLYPAGDDPLALADARDARAEIDLWLAHQDNDFMAIDDLAVTAGLVPRIVDTPGVDAALWKGHDITTRSYATVGTPPFSVDDLRAKAGDARGIPAILDALRRDVPQTDYVYRASYSACAGGPFDSMPVTLPLLADPTKTRTVERWENDGIVNTASMLPPNSDATFLVEGDHADIIGHFMRQPHATPSRDGRQADAYDLLGSDDRFDGRRFALVWNHLFDFAIPPR